MIVIYGSSLSPYVRKTLVFAAEKGIEVENRITGPGSDPDPDFLACSPFRKIPALKDGDFQVCDSTAIVTYLDAIKPEPELIPADPRLKARTIWLEEFADTILIPAGARVFFNRVVAPLFLGRPGDLAAADKAEREELPPLYDWIETQIPESGFLVGDRFTLADIAVASPFATLARLDMAPDAERTPRLAAFLASIHGRPAFARLITAEKAFVDGFRQRQTQPA
jgi:glutathione S-transferase